MSNLKAYDVIGVGRAVYDRAYVVANYPEADEKTVSTDYYESGGSPVPTALCQLSQWGWSTALNARVGDDWEAKQFISSNEKFNVDNSFVVTTPNTATPHALLIVEKGSGKRTVILNRTIAPLSPKDLPLDNLRSCRCLLLDGWEAEAAIESAKLVKSSGGKIVMDAGHVRPRMEEQLALVDWLVVPLIFIKDFLPGMELFAAAKHLLTYGCELVVITNGAGGCVAAWDGNANWFRSYKPDQMIDSTGAGDIFHAGMIHGLLSGWSFEDSIRWSAACGSLAVEKLGGRGKLPSEKEVIARLEENGELIPGQRGV